MRYIEHISDKTVHYRTFRNKDHHCDRNRIDYPVIFCKKNTKNSVYEAKLRNPRGVPGKGHGLPVKFVGSLRRFVKSLVNYSEIPTGTPQGFYWRNLTRHGTFL
jgi:hypothetical protein